MPVKPRRTRPQKRKPQSAHAKRIDQSVRAKIVHPDTPLGRMKWKEAPSRSDLYGIDDGGAKVRLGLTLRNADKKTLERELLKMVTRYSPATPKKLARAEALNRQIQRRKEFSKQEKEGAKRIVKKIKDAHAERQKDIKSSHKLMKNPRKTQRIRILYAIGYSDQEKGVTKHTIQEKTGLSSKQFDKKIAELIADGDVYMPRRKRYRKV